MFDAKGYRLQNRPASPNARNEWVKTSEDDGVCFTIRQFDHGRFELTVDASTSRRISLNLGTFTSSVLYNSIEKLEEAGRGAVELLHQALVELDG